MKIQIFLTTLLLAGGLYASELREPVGTRDFSPEEIEAIQELQKSEEEESESGVLQKAPLVNGLITYCIQELGYKGGSMIFCDGTIWAVSPSDQHISAYWHIGDPLHVTTNDGWLFTGYYGFRIVNRATGESVQATMMHGPYVSKTAYVTYLDYDRGLVEVTLPDGHIVAAHISTWDHSLFSKWLPGDRILFGVNTRWNSGSNPYIFLNVETLTSCRGDLKW